MHSCLAIFAAPAQLLHVGLQLNQQLCFDMQAPSQTLHIGVISRTRGGWNSRAMVNEDEFVIALQQRYPRAVLERLYYNESILQSMAATRRQNVLIGMHGAGRHTADYPLMHHQTMCKGGCKGVADTAPTFHEGQVTVHGGSSCQLAH